MLNKIIEFFKPKINQEKKEYTCCRFLQGGITFQFTTVRTCCSNKCGVFFVEDYKGGKIDWKDIARQRKNIIENCKKGIIPKTCLGCVDLETKEWEESNKLTEIYFLHWDHCNCGCIYCLQKEHGEFLVDTVQKSKYYDVLNNIKDLYSRDMISKDVHVELIGGDLAILDETDELIETFLAHGTGRMSFHSSGIKYSKGLEKALQQAYCDVDFSLDSGCAETYKKIKKTDSFDKVVENLTRYANCHHTASDRMVLKYILVDGLNDNIEELEKWLQITKQIGIKRCKIDVNFRRFFPEYHHSNQSVPAHYYDIFNYFSSRAKELGLEECCWEYTKLVMQSGGIPQSYK